MIPPLHRDYQYSIRHIGNDAQPLIVIDQFLAGANTLIDYALQRGGVIPAGGFYPGVRSPVPELYKQAIIFHLGDLICQTFKLKLEDISTVDSCYSMVATPCSELKTMQQIPHVDQAIPEEIAMIHYLCDGSHGGTSFYRHRQTGFECIDQTRIQQYKQMLDTEIEQIGLPQPAAYINGNTDLFEQIASIDARFNRVLIYRCSSLHSGNIENDYAFDMNPRTGRFTITSFLYK